MQRSTKIPIPSASGTASQHLLSYGFAKPAASMQGKKTVAADSNKSLPKATNAVDMVDDINKNGAPNGGEENATAGTTHPAHSSNLTTSELNVLSYNLSELADRISPTKTDLGADFPVDGIEESDLNSIDFEELTSKPTKTGDRPRSFSEHSNKERDSASLHSKLPYSRRSSRKAKSYVPKRKSFRKQTGGDGEEGFYGPRSKESQLSLKTDSEDSGYGSSRSTFSQKGNSENSRNDAAADLENDDSELLTRKISDVEKRLRSLLIGESLASGAENSTEYAPDSANVSQKSGTAQAPSSNSKVDPQSSATNFVERDPPVGADDTSQEEDSTKFDPVLGKSPFHPPKGKTALASQDDSALQRGCPRPTLVRRRTTLMSFRRSRLMAAQEPDGEGVELDEATYTQCVGDIKSMKTMLLKLKRELQEAEVVSPLSRSFTVSASSTSSTSPKSLRRSGTCDAASMHDKLMRIRASSMPASAAMRRKSDKSGATPGPSGEDEVLSLRQELKAMKEKVDEMTQERRSLLIEREEHEHELESKNLTIRLLQKQLESQDNQDEMAYLKRQVKLLSEQVHNQQNKISELRGRLGPATPVATPGKKEPVKADMRNRLRDAFVRHLDQSAKNHAQLSKHIQRAENSISEAQKGLKSLVHSPPVTSHSSMDELDDCAINSQRTQRSRVRMVLSDLNAWFHHATGRQGSSRRSSTAESVKSDGPAEHSPRIEAAKKHDEPLRRSSVPILGTRPSEHEIEAGAHTDSERHSPRKQPSAHSARSDRRRSRLSRSGPTSWAPGTIEKIVKSWKETRDPSAKMADAQAAPDAKLGPPRGQAHVDFL